MKNGVFAPKGGATVAGAKTVGHVEPVEETRSAAPTRFVPDNIEDVQRMARMFYYGGLMKKHFYRDASPEGARNAIAGIATMIIYGAELGLSPTQAFRTMHVIEGAPTLSAAGKVALVKRSPKCHSFEVIEESDEHCTCETVRLRPDGTKLPPRRLTVRIWWGDAKAIPTAAPGTLYVLPTRDSKGAITPVYQRFPGRLAKARCSSWLCDNVYEDVTNGLYSTEEIIDFADRRTSERMVEDIFDMVDAAPATPARGEASEDAPVSPPISATEQPQEPPAKPSRDQEAADVIRRIQEVSDSTTIEQWAELRALAESFDGTPHFAAVKKAWGENPFSPRKNAQVAT